MVSFPISSSRGSASRDHSPAITPGSPGPSRLSKSDVANYLSFASHLTLDPREEHDLAWKLSHPIRSRKDEAPTIIQPEPGAGAGVDLADVELENEVEHQSTSPDKPRRVDGPSFAPTYQDDQRLIHQNKKRKRDVGEDKERDGVRWPISIKELDKQNQKNGGTQVDSLEDTIKSFVISYIRSNGLKSSYSTNKHDSVEGEESLSNGILDPDLEQEIESTLSDDLFNSAKDFLNRLLVNLAILRPADIGKKRRQMGTIDWMGVLGAASLDKDFQP
ncbi:hypothetical protein I302_100595 [Kwoniella bestiolae CBS 10118]|uniref:Uncharacterized protein n=1 Tax=Kwoniella bestiolae CBS 10118 TaxID=1296100 RepID=A0A1B9G5H9_9TREE|nr:hypothetical protein I302_03970 [Kwoniella bestiolae CBS 10118]OCF26287.1 hypothetical protein I302_03970 [Kwoniella bestiolae CBS 10118]